MIVILSTLNGNSRLREMLEALLRVRIPPGTRFHVVDNGSEDGTLDLLDSFSDRLPLVIYKQPVRGKNHCVNLVLDAVSTSLDPAELVVLTDDDILPSPEWLEELEAAGKAHPDRDVFAGRILPPARPQSLPAAQAVLQRSYAPRQLTLPPCSVLGVPVIGRTQLQPSSASTRKAKPWLVL